MFPLYGNKDAAWVAYLGLFVIQRRGQQRAGIKVADGCRVWGHKSMGLVSEVLWEEPLAIPTGSVASGNVRCSTTGSSVLSKAKPFLAHHG